MKKIINYTIFACILLFGFIIKANASGITIRSTKKQAYVGDSISITVSTNDPIGSYKLTTSNSGVLNFSGQSSGGFQSPSAQETYRMIANSPGTVTVSFVPLNMASVSNESKYTEISSITITVTNKPVVTLSSDNTLASLSVEGKELSQPFDKNTLEYGVSLDPDTTSIIINAKASNGGATISGIGEVSVQDGDNRLEIVVTAENGSQKTYVINANVKEYDPITVKVDGKDYTVIRKKASLQAPNNYQETTVTINDNEVPAFKSDITGYTLVGLKDENGNPGLYVYNNDTYTLYKEYSFNRVILYPIDDASKIPSNYKKDTITFNDQTIIAYKLKKSSKYALIYGMNVETGEEHLYMYDSKEDTLQIYNEEEIKVLKNKNDLYLKIMIGLGSLSIVLIIIIIIMAIKKNKVISKKIES